MVRAAICAAALALQGCQEIAEALSDMVAIMPGEDVWPAKPSPAAAEKEKPESATD